MEENNVDFGSILKVTKKENGHHFDIGQKVKVIVADYNEKDGSLINVECIPLKIDQSRDPLANAKWWLEASEYIVLEY